MTLFLGGGKKMTENLFEEIKKEENLEEALKEENNTEEVVKPKKDLTPKLIKAKIVDCKLLNIRKNASLDSDILGVLNEKNVFYVDKKNSTNDFYKIKYNNVNGYCLKKYVKII